MKNVSAARLQYLQSVETTDITEVFAFTILLTNGMVITATDGQLDFVYSGVNYFAARFGQWECGSISSEVGTSSNQTQLTVYIQPDEIPLMPGSTVTIFQAISAGLFDGASLIITSFVMPTYGDTSMGPETKFAGDMGEITGLTMMGCIWNVHDKLYRLNRPMPIHLVSTNCGNTLFDARCTLFKPSFMTVNSVAAGSNQYYINLANALAGPHNYDKGELHFFTGLNAGIAIMIRQQISATQVLLTKPPPFALTIGDSLQMYPGCDQTQATCTTRFNNIVHFTGCPLVPDPEIVL